MLPLPLSSPQPPLFLSRSSFLMTDDEFQISLANFPEKEALLKTAPSQLRHGRCFRPVGLYLRGGGGIFRLCVRASSIFLLARHRDPPKS